MRGIETTVRALRWARVRHFVVGVACAVLAVTAFGVRNRLADRLHAEHAAWPSPHSELQWIPRHASAAWISTAEWIAFVAGGLAWYNLREWRGKGRRYRNQRQRAANELLRTDFRRKSRADA